ncbi:hypothetical protein Slala02_62530 [Streptomyces lavendulae subsp. lavendulae]|nr:hypothetical protein Slala01_66150 [Streptomyces lavendulae subsp. lavendulae]GLX30433.1 hypothetical protein Slala02_62530 [Streptomyces lavendulae subsp. lavendulae]
MSECYEYVPHRLLRKRVRDIASGVEGELMAGLPCREGGVRVSRGRCPSAARRVRCTVRW